MVKVLPPYKPVMPHPEPGMALSIAPAGHYLWLEDYEYFDQLGRDPLQQAEIWGISDRKERVERLKELLEKYPKSKHRREILFKAAWRGDDDIVRCIVGTGLEICPDVQQARKDKDNKDDIEDEETESIPDMVDPDIVPLHVAAGFGKLDCVKIMLEGGAPVDALDEYGRTPLIRAALSGEMETMRYLLDQGANPVARTDGSLQSSKDSFGEYANADALEYVVLKGKLDGVQMLLDRGKDSGISATPLALKGAAGANFGVLKLLMDQAGFPTEGKDDKTKAELLDAEQKQIIIDATSNAMDTGDLESLKFLLSYQYPVDANGELLPFELPESSHKSWTYGTYSAVLRNFPDKFEFMHSFNIKEHDTMSLDELPPGQLINIQHLFDKAAQSGSLDSVKLLIEKYGAEPDAHRLPPGTKPLWAAAGYNKAEVVRYLLDQNVNIHAGNGRYATGPTALWTAVTTKSLESIKLLLEYGGPVDHLDENVLRVMEPTTAILRTEFGDKTTRPTTRLELESDIKDFVDKAKNDFMDLNPRYVRLEIGPEDMAWIEKLQIRKRDSLLKEGGTNARELNIANATPKSQLEKKDPRQFMPAFPLMDEDYMSKFENDDDLAPKFRPYLVPAGRDDNDDFL